jgi:hypothetical protein
MGVNVFLHYYVPSDRLRSDENNAVCRQWAANRHVDKLIVIRKPGVIVPARPHAEIELPEQPTLSDYRDAIERHCGNDDIAVVPNADCFIPEEDTARLGSLEPGEAYCLSRIEIKSIRPLRRYFWRNYALRRRHSCDSQDCWIFRGKLASGMWLSFPLGKPGSDNRFAYELQKAGLRIVDPWPSIRLYHYHRSKKRNYTESDRVPRPYAFPERKGHSAVCP